MKESFYRLPGPRPLRLTLVADLHGQAPDAVLASLRRRKPDLICVAGDFVHGVPSRTGLNLLPETMRRRITTLLPRSFTATQQFRICSSSISVSS